jgi:ABC-2 type transport system ATP-binding protein
VAPLISVGVGFYAEMSGRENVYVNGMLLGLSKEEIDERFDEIVGFAELAGFIDTPVKFYSSGMYMRLGFSVAVHTDPQILLVDEVLAVGDISFQMKCFDKMKEIREAGTTLVVVSHNVQAIRVLCPRVMVVAHGRVVHDGDPDEAIALHHEILEKEAREQQGTARPGEASVVGGVTIVERELTGPNGRLTTVTPGMPLRFRLRLHYEHELVDPGYYFTIHDEAGTLVYAAETPVAASHRTFRAGEESDLEFGFTAQLEGGLYRMGFAVTSGDRSQTHCSDTAVAQFFVDPGTWSYGIAKLDGEFAVDGKVIDSDGNHRLDGGSHLPESGM